MTGASYFDLFGLPPGFDVDEAALHAAYLALQRRFHPDRYAGKPASERQLATQTAVRINDGYHTLREPARRAQYLLQLQGIRVNAGQDSVTPAAETLMEVMELQEQLAEHAPSGLAAFAQAVQARLDVCLAQLGAHFAGAEYGLAAQATLRLQYLNKLSEDIRVKRHAVS